ncbi:hypothetical protein JQ580_24850 [Bradyrhizobium japonicum]|uniref:hypothetical protein n=1 Tax=Bradyrhizobium japonicum TaxID=375 RepID=UPI001BAE457C|nr:hypothetical protein [Bradyrhizobium japonicum]MBR0993957.1 hypothetical protein [Bradyrhizobium japonicum]
MSDDEHDNVGKLDRRSMLAGGAATVALNGLPGFAKAAESGTIEPHFNVNLFGAVYMDPRYLNRFNGHTYSAANIQNVQTKIKQAFPNRSDLKWGAYQKLIEPDSSKWGTTAAFNNWLDLSNETRDDLEKLPAKFARPERAMNPFDTGQVASNLLEHLDEVVRIALWDHAVPLKISVLPRRARHHGLVTEWDTVPPPSGVNPNLQLKGLTIYVQCPQGGWQGYAIWRNRVSTSQITKFAAKWKVPQAPIHQDSQILFIFNGLESVSRRNATGGILQPVLQWTKTDGWYVRSWYVTADFDPVKYPNLPDLATAVGQDHLGDENRCYSKAVKVNPGDTVVGNIKGTKDATGRYNYICHLEVNGQRQADTELRFDDIPELTFAVCAIESYDVAQKPADRPPYYPSAPITLSSLDLQVDSRPVPAPIAWKKSKKLGGDYTATPNANGNAVEFKLV